MGTVKGSGSLSLENDVLPKLPAAAPSDGGATIGSNAVSMSDFYESVAGGAPASGAISFSDFYSVNNQYSVSNVNVNEIRVSCSSEKDGPVYTTSLASTAITGRIGYRYGNRSTATSYTSATSSSFTDTKEGTTESTFWNITISVNTNTLAAHYSTYS